MSSDYVNQSTTNIFRIKTTIENNGGATPEEINDILSMWLDQIIYTTKLEKQLEYALTTGGALLEVGEEYYN